MIQPAPRARSGDAGPSCARRVWNVLEHRAAASGGAPVAVASRAHVRVRRAAWLYTDRPSHAAVGMRGAPRGPPPSLSAVWLVSRTLLMRRAQPPCGACKIA